MYHVSRSEGKENEGPLLFLSKMVEERVSLILTDVWTYLQGSLNVLVEILTMKI